jgi:hypothetical protein
MYINFKCTQPYIGTTPWYCTVQSPEVELIRVAEVRGSSRQQPGPTIFFYPAPESRKWPTPERCHDPIGQGNHMRRVKSRAVPYAMQRGPAGNWDP